MTTPQDTLNTMVKAHNAMIKKSEKALVAYALEHELNLYLGDYGNGGKTLVLKDGDPSVDYHDKQRGEWLYSSETC